MNANLIRLCGATLCAGALLLSPATSNATVLVPGGTVVPSILLEPAGTLVDAMLTPMLGSSELIANLRSAVVQNAAGTLDFYYQIGSHFSSAHAIATVSNLSFAIPALTFATEVFFRLENGGLDFFHDGDTFGAPLSSSRSADGVIVDFHFGNLNLTRINSGEVSRIMVIRTNATNYVPGLTLARNGVTVTGDSFAPFAPSTVPEPTSLLLLGSAFAAAGYMARHRAARRKPTTTV